MLREELLIVTPQEHDIVRVIGGSDNVGLEGELVCIDGTDAIVKEHNENRIVDFIQLAKVRLL